VVNGSVSVAQSVVFTCRLGQLVWRSALRPGRWRGVDQHLARRGEADAESPPTSEAPL